MDESVWCVLISPPFPELRKEKAVKESPHGRIEGVRPTRFTCPFGSTTMPPSLEASTLLPLQRVVR